MLQAEPVQESSYCSQVRPRRQFSGNFSPVVGSEPRQFSPDLPNLYGKGYFSLTQVLLTPGKLNAAVVLHKRPSAHFGNNVPVYSLKLSQFSPS